MKKIIAIGGGKIGNPKNEGGYFPIETTKIDEEAIKLTGKKSPNVLFLPTASSDSKTYCDTFINYFQNKLKCRVTILHLTNKKLTQSEIKEKIFQADVIYVGGGNTLNMINLWKKLGVDTYMKQAYEKGIVLTGLSAGSICWFSCGLSDSRKYSSNSEKLIKVSGLNLIQALHCPHYDSEPQRKIQLKEIMKKTSKLIAIAIDDCCAIEIIDNNFRIISSRKSANAYKVYWKRRKYIEEKIEKSEEFKDLDKLLVKK